MRSHPSQYLLLATCAVSLLAPLSAADRTREFRPLEAKKIEIRTGASAGASAMGAQGTAGGFLQAGWAHFDNKEWEAAIDAFLSALEADPASRESAEALGMSIYHAGDYGAAYRLGEELKVAMPNVRRVLADTALCDVRQLVAGGKFAEARGLLTHFPATGPTLAYAHHLVETADHLQGKVGDSDMGVKTKPKSLVSN